MKTVFKEKMLIILIGICGFQCLAQDISSGGKKMNWNKGAQIGYFYNDTNTFLLGVNYQYAGFRNEETTSGNMKWLAVGPYFNILGRFKKGENFKLGGKIGVELLKAFPSDDLGWYANLNYEFYDKNNSGIGGELGIHFVSFIIVHGGYYLPLKEKAGFQRFRIGLKINISAYFGKAIGLDQGYF